MEDIQSHLGLDDQSYRKFKLFNRILISFNDFRQSHETASLLLDGNYYENYPEENNQLVIALNMAAIVAYARPFLDSKGELAHNRLPGKALRTLNAEEKEVHGIVITSRHTIMAHSDADANLSIPLVMDLGHRKVIVPKNASSYAAPLKPETMKVLCDISYKLQEYCFELRMEMEPEMLNILPEAQYE
jgi:hypothetical protein